MTEEMQAPGPRPQASGLGPQATAVGKINEPSPESSDLRPEAWGLRPAAKSPQLATVLAVTSGKGGVGKTSVSVNVALSMARLGYRIGLLDADFGLGNVDVMLGLTPQYHIGHLLGGEKTLDEVVMNGPFGVRVLPASSGLQSLTSMTAMQRTKLLGALDAFRSNLDFLVIDTAAGISDNVVETLRLAERVALVTSLEPSAVVDAYATAKVLTQTTPQIEIGVVVNGVRNGDEAGLAYKQLDVAASRFLGRCLRYYGFVAEDRAVRDSVLVQRAVVDHAPQAAASRCFRILASRLAGLGRGPGGLRLVGASASDGPLARTKPGSTEVSQCA